MIYTLTNNNLKIKVKQTGAELCSIKSLKSDQEFMWNADPLFWSSHAPVLFPIIGALKNNSYQHKGQQYSLPKHGFIRYNQNLEVQRFAHDTLTLGLKSSQETLTMYPFEFEFSITFKLEDNSIRVSHQVLNMGKEEMLFSLGGHPAFNCPFFPGEHYHDYYLEFEHEETAKTWELNNEGLVTNQTELILDKTNILPLHQNLFNRDALIFKDLKSRVVNLKSKLSDHAIRFSFHDFTYLGIWAKPGAPFVCIEPWLGVTDSIDATGELEQKEGMIKLPSDQIFLAEYTIEIITH